MAAVTLMLLTGCLSSQPAPGSEAYRQGYEAGCERAKLWYENSFSEYRRKPERYRSDPLYRSGFDEGYDTCFADKELEIWMERP
ncbi:hypothetical protein [Hydrogenimonas sp.]